MQTTLSRLSATAFIFAAILFFGVLDASAAETTRPTISKVTPTEAHIGEEITFSATYSDSSGVDYCKLYVEFADQGEMTLSNGVATMDYTFTGGGVYTVFVSCRDSVGNLGNGANTSVVVDIDGGGGSDTTPPVVGDITPTSAFVDTAVTLSATYSGASSCRLIVNGFDRGGMTLTNGVASRSYAFDEIGAHSVYVQCSDSSGNVGSGSMISVTVSEAPPEPPQTDVTPGLVKLVCPANSDATHSCRSVYYRASDGTRHAFPNERIFFTWYTDFSTVEEISAEEMADLSLGRNVTYRPGVRMIKFLTNDKVYAIGRAGLLRWVSSEGIATSLYGSNWNTMIDDLSDAFAADYSNGPEIMNASEFVPSEVTAATPTIEDNF